MSPGKYEIGRAPRKVVSRQTNMPAFPGVDGSLLPCEVTRELVLIWVWVSEGSANSLKFSASFGVSVQLSGEGYVASPDFQKTLCPSKRGIA